MLLRKIHYEENVNIIKKKKHIDKKLKKQIILSAFNILALNNYVNIQYSIMTVISLMRSTENRIVSSKVPVSDLGPNSIT